MRVLQNISRLTSSSSSSKHHPARSHLGVFISEKSTDRQTESLTGSNQIRTYKERERERERPGKLAATQVDICIHWINIQTDKHTYRQTDRTYRQTCASLNLNGSFRGDV